MRRANFGVGHVASLAVGIALASGSFAACKRNAASRANSQPLSTASFPPAPPTPPGITAASVGGHPRIWITAADLPRLRSWANPQNPAWRDGLAKALEQALVIYDKEFYPGGHPNPKWPDAGIDNFVSRASEAFAEFFAFMSLVDPNEGARAAHAERAKNLLMYVIREAAKGVDTGNPPGPFRGRQFATFNRASSWGEGFGLTVDWIYASLDAEEKALIRRVFMRWADECIHASTAGNEHPEPIGAVNDRRLVADTKRLRWSADNYFTAHMRQLTLYGLSFDAADDPPIDPAAPVTKLGNSLRSYLDNAVGAWLYQAYAIYEDPSVVAPAYGVPPAGIGFASGGLSPEGFLYGASIGMLHETLLALYTAGYRDPKALGPQIRMIESRYWDLLPDGVLHSIMAEPAPVPGEEYLGPVYQMAAYGDTQRIWLTPDYAKMFLSMSIYDAATGHAQRLEKSRWLIVNAMEGTAAALGRRMSNVWGNSGATLSIQHFLALDPAAKPAPDPRASLPLAFVDKPIGRLIARNAWGPNATMFDYKCTWETISHQDGDCNEFEMWRKGEWLVRERTGYAVDMASLTSEFHNTLAIQNKVQSGADKPKSLQWFETETWTRGGQFTLGTSGGDPKVRMSVGPAWAYAEGDATDLYNRMSTVRSDDATDVAHASRSIAWLQPDFIVVYDRATTRSENLFKRFFLVSGGDPDVKGKVTTFTTPKGQKLFVETLLPATATATPSKVTPFNQLATNEPSRSKLMVEDPARPKDIRFLHALQGADAGAAAAPVRLVQSSAGTPFAGAVIGTLAAVFPVSLGEAFKSVVYSVPSTTTAQLVAGLQPGGTYDVALRAVGGDTEVTVTVGTAYTADEAGVLALGSYATKKP